MIALSPTPRLEDEGCAERERAQHESHRQVRRRNPQTAGAAFLVVFSIAGGNTMNQRTGIGARADGSGSGVGGGDGGRGWAVTEAVAGSGLAGRAEAESGMGQAPPDKVPIPGIAAALRGLDSKPKQRISRRQLVRNGQHLDIA